MHTILVFVFHIIDHLQSRDDLFLVIRFEHDSGHIIDLVLDWTQRVGLLDDLVVVEDRDDDEQH